MNGPMTIEFHPKWRQPGNYGMKERHVSAKVDFMTITEDEALDIERLSYVHHRMMDEHHINLKFILVPNGTFLPVPISHYLP